ncbi:MAG TPA: Gfo/Idh/MocA family oxidoreductase [Sedimentisphaerales bacterium]|nr:Gfo/Idh/MocA family oxidoreductase [Sedimentisphaerales bacterium]
MKDQKETTKQQSSKISRRDFMGGAAAAAMAFTIVPSHVLAQPPSEKLNIASIGSGGMGGGNTRAAAGAGGNIVALCDVDWDRAADTFKRYPKAKRYKDFRKMLDNEKSIEAVIVATPDHFHTVAAMAAMRRGKHVYVQKPLTRLVSEARALTEAARKYKVVTQMGNQGHSGDGVRDICEWIWAGVIGDVKEVHAWTNRPVWPQGIDRPKEEHDIPDTLDWDLWIGPSPMRPYNKCYAPFSWRGWWDFGGGALADMACHVLDPVFSALKLKYPTSVEACATKVNEETFPLASIVRYEFPAREGMPAVKINWYDGGMKPPRPEALEENRPLNQASSNVLFMGTKGVLRCGEYGDNPRLLPLSRMREFNKNKPPQTLPRIKTSHEGNWIEACKTGGQATSHFDYAGPFTETVVMGNLAIRPENVGKKLLWDGDNMKVTNEEKANEYVNMHYRDGWSLEM